MLKSIFSGILILAGSVLNAQSTQPIEDLLQQDSVLKIKVYSFHINSNVLRLGETLLNNPRNGQEIQGELAIHKFYVTMDFGTQKSRRGDDYVYSNDGSYWRAGLDVNMSANWQDGNMIGMGLRYGRASFDEYTSFTKSVYDTDGNVFFEQNIDLTNPNASAQWAEIVFKMRGKIWKNFYTGYTMRFQFFMNTNTTGSELRTFDIPGYGKITKPNSFGFDYYIGWRFNFD